MRNHRFRIAGGSPGLEVSWQVTGIRQDAWAKAYPLHVEEEKPAAERGKYLHPELYQTAEKTERLRALRLAKESAETDKPKKDACTLLAKPLPGTPALNDVLHRRGNCT